VGGVLEVLRIRAPFVGLPFFFVWINAAALAAMVRLLRGEKFATWETRR
jgi:hypothetical protein